MWSVRFACLLLLSFVMVMTSVAATNRMTVDHNNTAPKVKDTTSVDSSKEASTDSVPVDPPAFPSSLAMPVAILPEENDETPVDTSTVVKDVFHPVNTAEPVVDVLIQKFLTIYRAEVARTSLDATVVNIIKAERTNVRQEMQEKQVDADGIGMEFVEEAQTQQYRIYLLLQYHFQSAMLAAKRPYVSVLRVTMDCYNTTTQDDSEHELDQDDTEVDLACDILDHKDLPRRNGSAAMVPQFLQRQIFHSAPQSYVSNHTLRVIYDAVEAQDMSMDANDEPIAGQDTMHFVRFRVKGGNAQDCMVVVEHAGDVNTLRYQDTVCYEGAEALAAEMAALQASTTSFQLTKANLPVFIGIASVVGAIVAFFLIHRQRTKQRSGYSYVHSNHAKMSHVPTASTSNTDVAIAC